MMSEYKFTLPYPPTINSYWATYNNRRVTSKRGRDYVKLVCEVMDSLGLSGELISSNVNLSMTINPPTMRSYDVDNFTKGVFDALTKCEFWVDDVQVQKLTVKKGAKVSGGNAEIKVSIIT